jgi:hypothetical protein
VGAVGFILDFNDENVYEGLILRPLMTMKKLHKICKTRKLARIASWCELLPDQYRCSPQIIRLLPMSQDSPHIVKTGRPDFSLSWLKGEVRENLGDFRKSIQILTFLSPLPFTKTNVLHYDLKKDAINEFGIKYWTSNPVWVTFQEHGSSFHVNIEEKVWLLVKKIRTGKDWQGD